MGSTYTRQSTFTDGDTITADLFNTEFDQLVAAFAASSGHSHDGTAGEGGPIGGLITPGITLGDNTIDVTLTFDGGSNDGVLKWMEDEDYFEFSDDILIASTEKLQFRDTAIYINSSADGQLDLVADTEIQIAATTIDINGAADISGNLAVGGNLTVTGTTTFNGGTITLGDAAADNVVFGADVDSSIIPDDDDTYDLGSSSQQWRNLFIDGTAEIDTLAINGTTVTATAAELNIMDGVTATAAELNILDGVTATATELNLIDGVTATTAELNILDGVTSTAAELNILDGKAFLDEDNFASNSATGIASQQSIKAYVDGVTTTSITSTGALNAGSITSGFGSIDNGSSTITTTGLISGGSLDIDNVLINGTTIGHTDDTDLITLADGVVTVAGEVSMTTLDIGGTNVTSTAAELNALDGITAVVGELNALDLGSTAVGTAIASKAVVLDSNKDYTGVRNFTITGNLSVGGTTTVVDTVTMNAQNAVLFEGATADAHETTLTIVDPTADRTINLPNQSGTVPVLAAASNTAVTSTPEELNILDGVTATAAELNILDVSNTTIGDLSEISTAANDDVFIAVDTSGGGLKKITRSAIIAGTGSSGDLANVVEDTSPQLGGNLDMNGADIVTTSNATLDLAPNGTGTVVVRGNTNSGAVVFNCESNSHGQKVYGQPHSAGVTNTLMLPAGANSTLVSLVSTDTLTNKTLTSPKINEDVAVTSTATELNLLDGVTATTAELNILDGVTSTAAELNALDGITAVVGELNALDLGSTAVGTAIASKAMVLDSNKDYTGVRNFTLSGELDAGSLDISGNADIDGTLETDALSINGTTVTSTAAELNILDGVTATAAEINLIDGGTARGTTAVADGDGVLINDAGTMRMTSVDTLSTYMSGKSVGGSNIVTTGALNSGTITSGFGNIDTGSSTITTTGLISGGSLDIDNVLINGTTIGHTDDTDLITVADGLVTVAGEVQMTTLDIGGTNVTSTAAELNLLDGSSANSVVNSKAVIYGSSGELAGALSTAAQTNVTSLGTLTALTVDDVAIDGKAITMTGSSSDTAVFTVGTNGTLSIVTTDDAAAAANIQITADGTAELAGTTVTLDSGGDIDLAATNDVNLPANVGLTFGNDAEKIEGDGTDLTIAGNNIKLTAVADVVIPANVGVTFGSGEKIEGNNTDLTVTSGAKINLAATSDVHIPNDVGIVFGGASEKIEGDGTDLTISGAKINLAAVSDVHLANNIGIVFGDAGEKIEGDGTNLAINSSGDLNVTATTIDIDGNVEISGTAVTTGVHTFTAVPVFPNNTVETADIQADAITGAKIADDAINSEHYTDGSIDTAHIADANVTQAKIADQAINEAKMQISNAPTNGYMLTAQSGNTGGLTWAEAGGGATELITRTVISDGDASVIFTGFDASVYESYEIYFANVVSQTDNRSLSMATSSDGGSSYDESSTDYSITVLKESSASALTLTDYNDSTIGGIYLSLSTGAVETAEVDQGVSGKMEIFGAGNASKYTAMNYTTGYPGVNASSIDNSMFWQGVAHRSEAAVVDAIRFQFSTFESGTISFYGIKK